MSCVFNSARSRIWLIWTAVTLEYDCFPKDVSSDQEDLLRFVAAILHLSFWLYSTRSWQRHIRKCSHRR